MNSSEGCVCGIYYKTHVTMKTLPQILFLYTVAMYSNLCHNIMCTVHTYTDDHDDVVRMSYMSCSTMQ